MTQAATYTRERGAPFDGLDRLLQAADELEVVIVDDWWVLGEDSATLIQNIDRIYAADLELRVVAAEDSPQHPCSACNRARPRPMEAAQAARHRYAMSGALGEKRGDGLAYCFATSTVLVGPPKSRAPGLCACDLYHWQRASEDYNRDGAQACWARLGVTEAHMVRARASSNEELERTAAEVREVDPRMEALWQKHNGTGTLAPEWDPSLPRDRAILDEMFQKIRVKIDDPVQGARSQEQFIRIQKQIFRIAFDREPKGSDLFGWDRSREHEGLFPRILPEGASEEARNILTWTFADFEAARIEMTPKTSRKKIPRAWDENALIDAKELWDASFGKGGDESDLVQVAAEELVEEGRLEDDVPEEEKERRLFERVAFGLWAESGYPTLTTGHTFAAALGCTTVARENAEDIEIPWTTFMVRLPDGMFTHPSGAPMDRLLICQHGHPRRSATATIYDRETGSFMMMRSPEGSSSLADVLFVDEAELLAAGGESTSVSRQVARLWRVLMRVVVGMLYTMQHTDNWKSKYPLVDSKRSYEKGPPTHRIVIVGRALSYDARPGLTEYLRGDRGGKGPPSVQSLVTGHYKRQVVGIGRMGRKVIWVEPYWRGPKDAPILMRPKKIG